jgi:hypothetical protein
MRRKKECFNEKEIIKIKKLYDNIKNNKNIIKNNKNTTHIIEYVFAQHDLEDSAYADIYKLLTTAQKNSNIVFDIMLYTKLSGYFIHIEKGEHNIYKFNKDLFFTQNQFDKFMKIVKNNQKKMKKNSINQIFVMGGHCSGWYCYCEKFIVNFNYMCKAFEKYKMHFDLITFDSCYTSTFELIYEFYKHCDYMLAHQTYVNSEGFNSPNLSNIFDTNYSFYIKVIMIAYEYIDRSLIEPAHASVSIIHCKMFDEFINLFKINYKEIRKVIVGKEIKKYYTDLCTRWLGNCMGRIECSQSICNNMVDLHKVLKIVNNKQLYELLDKSLFFLKNGIALDTKYFNNKIKFGGMNIIINNKKIDNYYKKLQFYKNYY